MSCPNIIIYNYKILSDKEQDMSQKKTSGGSLSHGAGARTTTSGTSARQDGARSPKQRPSQPPKR